MKKCKICSSDTTIIKNKKIKKEYYSCSYCKLIFIDKKYIINKEQEEHIYNLHNNSIDDPKYVAYFKHFLNNAVIKYAADEKIGLDFGSGPSPVLSKILERDYDYKMDIYDFFYSPKKVYKNNTYSLITCTEVVEHLEDPLSYFRLFASLLKKNGTLNIMTLFHPDKEDDFKHWWYTRDPTHITFYTPKTMKVVAQKVGLQLIYTDNCRYTVFKKV